MKFESQEQDEHEPLGSLRCAFGSRACTDGQTSMVWSGSAAKSSWTLQGDVN